ncbi:hypothetical protein NKG99_24240 [Mesorhizobium sp. M1409]|uniref:hypothetical protein n=1 Tax=unclassified Mesorhizobium TaxID=325217 RepID=UPI0033383736
MTDLNPDADVQTAAEWLANAKDHPSPVVPEIRVRFGLNTLQAVEAIRRAQGIRWGRAT